MAATPGASPSMLSSRFRALVTTTTHTIVSGRSRTAVPNTPPPLPVTYRATAAATSTASLTGGWSPRASSTRPKQAIAMAATRMVAIWIEPPAATTPVTPSPAATAAPPRYGVGSTWVL